MYRGLTVGMVAALLAAGLTGCVATVPEPSPTHTSARPSPETTSRPTPSPTATQTVAAPDVSPPPPQAPEPLITVSGTVTDTAGQSLTVTIAVVDVQPLTARDREEIADSACEYFYEPAALSDPEARMVTMSVKAVGSPGFSTWTDDRGVVVSGTLFDGPMWRQPAHSPGAPCVAPSRIVEPGLGSARLVVTSDWNVPKPLPADGAITLATYGFSAQVVDALGQPTGTPSVQGCTITTSAELDALVAATAPGVQWGSNVPLPDYCFIGRNPGGLD